MDLFWAILIVATVVILLFAVLPSLVESPRQAASPATAHAVAPNVATLHPSQMVSPATRRDDVADRALLDSHYVDAPPTIPIDYPVPPIGSCPFSKPPSTDLPLPDVPMCIMRTGTDMRLASSGAAGAVGACRV